MLEDGMLLCQWWSQKAPDDVAATNKDGTCVEDVDNLETVAGQGETLYNSAFSGVGVPASNFARVVQTLSSTRLVLRSSLLLDRNFSHQLQERRCCLVPFVDRYKSGGQ
jgi:hypothetical protein